MKVIFEFVLPEEEVEFRQAVDGAKAHSIIWDLDQFLRSKLKYGHPYKSADEALEDIRRELNEQIEFSKLNFD